MWLSIKYLTKYLLRWPTHKYQITSKFQLSNPFSYYVNRIPKTRFTFTLVLDQFGYSAMC